MSDILKQGSGYKGFIVLKVFELKDYHSTAVYLRHRKTGLEVLHIVNDETENLFAFTFRTPNPKGNGAAHIMEHSVLCGSEKYPLKDPFTQLSNQSVKTYLNAATYPDKTVYPASSTIEADYFNLMSVYGDAVFFPRLSPEIFAQEAHRLEIDKNGKPSIQGVVYNEMKGSYSSFESVAMDVPFRNLLKGSVYEEDSGGDPLKIPSLSYEDYIAFHNKWYRPENCFVFLYGNIPTTKQLDFLQDQFLTRLEKRNPDFLWKPSVKEDILRRHIAYVSSDEVKEPLFVKDYGPAGEGKEKGSTVFITWNLGQSPDAFSATEKIFLTGILLNHDGSPLQKALIECGLGEDSAPGMGLESFYDTLFTVGLRGVKKADVEKVRDVVFSTLNEIADNGISKEDIDSTLMALEFSHREIRRLQGPYAMSIMNYPINAWLYGNDIEKSFRLRSVLEKVRANIRDKKGYLESLVRRFLIDNKNYIVAQITPSKKYTEERNKAEQSIIAALMSNTTAGEVKRQNEALHAFQSAKDDTSCLPHLSPKDFIVDGKRVSDSLSLELDSVKGSDGSDVDYFVSTENTNGITYLDVAFPADVLLPEDYPCLPLFTDTVSDCGWGSLDWGSAAAESAVHTGGISASLLTNELCLTKNSAPFIKEHRFCGRDWVVFKLRVIDEELKKGLELLSDNINLVDFHDAKRLKDIALETRNDYESSIVPGGHQYAMLRALRHSSRVAAVDEIWNGISQLYTLRALASADQRKNAEQFRRIIKEIKAGGGFIHITAEAETIKKSRPLIEDFAVKTGLSALKDKRPSSAEDFERLTDIDGPVPAGENEVLVIPGQVGYAAETFPSIPYAQEGNAVMEICGHWLSSILLWERLRTIGGAYGAFCETDSVTGNILFATYRDPSPEKSNSVFEQCLREAASMDFSVDETEKAVMGTYSHFVTPKTPRAKGNIELLRVLYGINSDDRENKLLELLRCTPEELKTGFRRLADFSAQCKYRVIIGPENCIKIGKKVILPL